MLSRAASLKLRQQRAISFPHSFIKTSSYSTALPSTKYCEATHSNDNVPEEVQTFIDEKAHYLLPVYARPPIVFDHGKGMHIFDTQGRKYLDFSGGIAVNALGHSDAQLAQVRSSTTGPRAMPHFRNS
jgi:4-aminobutyrate aminotransferase-like enzyme